METLVLTYDLDPAERNPMNAMFFYSQLIINSVGNAFWHFILMGFFLDDEQREMHTEIYTWWRGFSRQFLIRSCRSAPTTYLCLQTSHCYSNSKVHIHLKTCEAVTRLDVSLLHTQYYQQPLSRSTDQRPLNIKGVAGIFFPAPLQLRPNCAIKIQLLNYYHHHHHYYYSGEFLSRAGNFWRCRREHCVFVYFELIYRTGGNIFFYKCPKNNFLGKTCWNDIAAFKKVK